MAELYWVSCEGRGILNPNERGFRSLEKAQALAAKEAEECSWTCQTPPSPDNELHIGRGNFRCGVLAAHGIHVYGTERGFHVGDYDVPDEKFVLHNRAGKRIDWTLEVVLELGTGYAADGHEVFYFSGPEQTDTGWDAALDKVAGGHEVLEATVRPTPFGRYAGDTGNSYPMQWRKGYGF
jgi:hypothetical protein